ncbi:RNA polymerase sigma-I factor [Oceanobacillus arenosus]|uniref:RNA polymerase sigma factor SigI n=1 Tax=Oceanobacillus arenosus TaxID=1229153 RepID=A0A3D8PSD4_9BACI|nr:RNA polymerase sigma-I factor [Oceanobacillus arenosus]RDW18158.1 RNA polymerase sigma-I factor [Oceanobacillus arenosus]
MLASSLMEEIPLEEMINSVQNGDIDAQNYLLQSYQPFIAKCASEVCKRYINPKRDDEYSIGLSGFNDAMFSYCASRGSTFLSFAKIVIKRKIIDYIRVNSRRPHPISLDEKYDEEQMENPVEVIVTKKLYQFEQDRIRCREEIMEYKEKLHQYKLTFSELIRVSPKHKDARESAIRTARILYEDPKLSEYVYRKRKLPIKDLVNKVEVSKKTLERNRKFILAIFIILSEDFIYLKDYLKDVDKRKN